MDFDETFSLTGRLATLRGLFAFAAAEDLDIHQADFVTAFLNSPLGDGEMVYVKIPDGFVDWLKELPDDSPLRAWIPKLIEDASRHYLKLKRSLYGLKQASRSWYLTIKSWYLKHGFRVSEADACLFVRVEKDGSRILIYMWVDDIVVVGKNTEWILVELKKDFRIKDLGPVKTMLGMKISRDRSEGTLSISQSHYIEEILKAYSMDDCKPIGTPMQSNIPVAPGTDDEVVAFRASGHNYRRAIGCLNYL